MVSSRRISFPMLLFLSSFLSLVNTNLSSAQQEIEQCIDLDELKKLVVIPDSILPSEIAGNVIIKVEVNEKGFVKDTFILDSDNDKLIYPVIKAISEARWSSLNTDGKPSTTSLYYSFKFNYNKNNNFYDITINEYFPVEKNPSTDLKELAKKLKYPEEAKINDIEGKVIVRVLIGKKGEVLKAIVKNSTNLIFNKSALDAVKKAKWEPATIDDKPVTCWVTIPIKFKLN